MKTSTLESLKTVDFTQKVLQSDKTVLLDFGADWCPPCKALLPTLKKIAADFKGNVQIYSVDADEEKDLAIEFGIKGLPTVLIFQNGKLKQTLVGRRPYEDYASALTGASNDVP